MRRTARAGEILGLDILRPPSRAVVDRISVRDRAGVLISVAIDRGAGQALLMFTTDGGVEIEQVAAENPAGARARSHRSARGV